MSVAVVVVSGTFGVMTVGGVVSEVVAGFAELIAAQFYHWWRFFAAFFEIPAVSMVTKNGNHELYVCERSRWAMEGR